MSRHPITSLKLLLISALIAAPMSVVFCTTTRAEEEKKQKTELHRKMESIDEGMKKLSRSLRKADQNEASLKVIDTIIGLARECKEMTPSHAAKLKDAERAKFIEDYRKSMTQLIDGMEQMKKAVVAGDNDKAKEIRKSLKDMEEDGHDKFMESDDRDAAKSKDAKSDK
jgi:soluble cytochrome b562